MSLVLRSSSWPLTFNFEKDFVISAGSHLSISSGAFGRKHHAAVMARIPQGSVLDGEVHLHPRNAECLYLLHASVFHQVGWDERATGERLQGVRNGTCELDVVSLSDCRRPGHWNIRRVKIGCKAEGQDERRDWTWRCWSAFRWMKIHTDNTNGNDAESCDVFCRQREIIYGVRTAVVSTVVETNADDEDDVILVWPLPLFIHHSSIFA